MTTAAAEEPIAGDRRRVCFSFAAYAKSLIDHLRSIGVPVTAGLSDLELTAIETSCNFSFPPDLRSILIEGLPVSAGFPNWRSSPPQQLRLLLSLPIAGFLNEISKENLWPKSFGLKTSTTTECVDKARRLLEKAPILVPIYRNFYIPSCPILNGNPIFYVRGGCVRCVAFDVADFFRRFLAAEMVVVPAWAAKSARAVGVWSELAGDADGHVREAWREEMGWRLRAGGWREDEVEEMMLLGIEGGDEARGIDRTVARDRESVMWHVRLLALALLRAGWSAEDVVYCMGSTDDGKKVTWSVDPARNEISMEPRGGEGRECLFLGPGKVMKAR